jgi:hypothetical protein
MDHYFEQKKLQGVWIRSGEVKVYDDAVTQFESIIYKTSFFRQFMGFEPAKCGW